MKAADISDIAVLEFLKHQTRWATHWDELGEMPSVRKAMPLETPPKVALAKMRQLLKRGLVGGCPCGCRGDWEITDAGRAFLEAAR